MLKKAQLQGEIAAEQAQIAQYAVAQASSKWKQ